MVVHGRVFFLCLEEKPLHNTLKGGEIMMPLAKALVDGLRIGLTSARTEEQWAAAREDESLFVVEIICDSLERAGFKRI